MSDMNSTPPPVTQSSSSTISSSQHAGAAGAPPLGAHVAGRPGRTFQPARRAADVLHVVKVGARAVDMAHASSHARLSLVDQPRERPCDAKTEMKRTLRGFGLTFAFSCVVAGRFSTCSDLGSLLALLVFFMPKGERGSYRTDKTSCMGWRGRGQ
jgi:hypothetical protein